MSDQREQFEQWACQQSLDMARSKDHPFYVDGVYLNGDTHFAWRVWQAARSAANCSCSQPDVHCMDCGGTGAARE